MLIFRQPVLGFEILEATTLSTSSYWFHPSYMTAAVQDELNIAEYDLGIDSVHGIRINSDLLFGYKQLDNKRVVQLS